MLNTLLDINDFPINVAIYKKVGDDFIFTDFNKKAEITESVKKNSLINKKLTEVFPGVKEFGLFDVLLRVDETGQSEIFESSFYKDERISGWRKNEVIKLPDGNIAVFYTDSSVEKDLEEHGLKLEKQLSETEALLEHQKCIFQKIIQDTETISVQGYDKNHEVLYWNRGSENLYGYSSDEALGKKIEDLIVPDFMKDGVYSAVEERIHNNTPIAASELTLKHKDGSDVHVYSHHAIVRDESNTPEMYCIEIDLSEIKKLQRELTEQKNFLNTILDVIPDLVWLKDLDGIYLKCNSKFEQFYGAKESEILGHTDFDFVDNDLATFFRNNDKLALENKSSRINEEYLTFADGSHEGLFETIKTPMIGEDGKYVGVVGIARDINDRNEKEEQLEIYAHYDILTGLANRALFMDRLKELMKKRFLKERYHSILFIDLDHFKEINDSFGHAYGDKVLIETAQRIKKSVRKGDTVARLGGDEFTVLLENIHSPFEAQHIAQKILDTLRKPFDIDNHKVNVTTSIGISIAPDDTKTYDELLNCADKAMYRAKAKSKDRYEFYFISPMKI
ncbi:MAG: diguanylate cyclase [Campylobacterota bacterium]|nr:diguanylate cyclase [Campylobacterota bacterium]